MARARLAARAAGTRAASRILSSTCSSRARDGSAEDIAQAIDSVGGQMDAFTAKERQLLHQGPRRASGVCPRGAVGHRDERFSADDIEREKEGPPRRDQDGRGHARRPGARAVHGKLLGQTIRSAGRFLGTKEWSSHSITEALTRYFRGAYTAPHLIVAAVGNVDATGPRSREAGCSPPSPRRRRWSSAARRFRARSSATRSWSRATCVSAPLEYRPGSQRPLFELCEHGAWRLDELAAVSETSAKNAVSHTRCRQPQRLSATRGR